MQPFGSPTTYPKSAKIERGVMPVVDSSFHSENTNRSGNDVYVEGSAQVVLKDNTISSDNFDIGFSRGLLRAINGNEAL
jgi:hypothetical protein